MIINSDTASGGAVAIMMALPTPDMEVLAITIVAGNVDEPQGSINAHQPVEFNGGKVHEFEGATAPLLRERGEPLITIC